MRVVPILDGIGGKNLVTQNLYKNGYLSVFHFSIFISGNLTIGWLLIQLHLTNMYRLSSVGLAL